MVGKAIVFTVEMLQIHQRLLGLKFTWALVVFMQTMLTISKGMIIQIITRLLITNTFWVERLLWGKIII